MPTLQCPSNTCPVHTATTDMPHCYDQLRSNNRAPSATHKDTSNAGSSVNLATAVPTSIRTMTGTIQCPKSVTNICTTQPPAAGKCNNGYYALPDGACTCKLQYIGDQ
jgi:hypothetical protein